MIIKCNGIINNQGSAPNNEDIAGFNENGYWILDGATGLNNKNLIKGQGSDAKWFVQFWNNYLKENLDKKTKIEYIVKNGIKEVKNQYIKQVGDTNLNKLDMPSASISIVRFKNKKLEYFSLGDCSIYTSVSGKYKIKDDSVSIYDDIIFDKMLDYRNNKIIESINKKNVIKMKTDENYNIESKFENKIEDLTFKNSAEYRKYNYTIEDKFDYRKLAKKYNLNEELAKINLDETLNYLKTDLIKNRLKKNTEDGYWILGFEEEAVKNALTGEILIDKNTDILLATDGYACATDRYSLVKDDHFLDYVKQNGTENVLNEIRTFEKDDSKISYIPRFKQMDDSTCVLLNLNNN